MVIVSLYLAGSLLGVPGERTVHANDSIHTYCMPTQMILRYTYTSSMGEDPGQMKMRTG